MILVSICFSPQNQLNILHVKTKIFVVDIAQYLSFQHQKTPIDQVLSVHSIGFLS